MPIRLNGETSLDGVLCKFDSYIGNHSNNRNTGVLMDFDALDNLDFGAAEEAIEELKKKQDEEAIVPGAGDNDCSSGACAI